MRAVALAVALALAACGGGGSAGADGGGGNPDTALPSIDGAGSPLSLIGSCLVVNGDNRDTGNALRVDCQVDLSRGGVPITNGQVRINPAPPGLQVQLLGEGEPGRYVGYYLAYGGSARVSAVAGDDVVAETPFAGPAIFQVTAPGDGATVPADAATHVTWTAPGDPLNRVDVHADSGYTANDLEDTGEHDVPVAAFVGNDVLTVLKWRTTSLGAAAAPGSEMTFSVQVPIDVVVEGTALPDAAP